jgi:glyoxylase-like metal-dependent hydrolase (beta-lactamase superfamily II)
MMAKAILAGACALIALVTPPAQSANFQAKATASSKSAADHAVAHFRIGSFDVFALSDGTLPLDVRPLLKGTSVAQVDALLARSFQRSPVETSINAYLVDTGSRLILIDTGAGELFGQFGGRLQHSLAAAGYRPEDVSDILLTHIHTDHSGGLTRAGKILFQNATVHAGHGDARFFLDQESTGAPPETRHHEEAMATVDPYRRAGKLTLFKGATQIVPGVKALPAPGHTPGHSIYRIESEGESLEVWGDLIHVGAVQLPRPEITITFDVDQPAARGQRLSRFRAAARDGRLVAAAHLNFPGIGRLREAGKGYDWVPAPHQLRQ